MQIVQTLLQESFTSKWWFYPEVEIWKVTENEPLNRVISTKANFLKADLFMNTIVQEERPDKCMFYKRILKGKSY